MNQHIRNQLSLMAWVMAALCGWAMFLSAHALTTATACPAVEPYASLPAAQK